MITNESSTDEQSDNAALASVFARQLEVSLMVKQAARILYDAKARWMNEPLMAWEMLTPEQRRNECKPLEEIVKGTK